MAEAATLIGRNAPPSHYSIKIEDFSLLKASTEKCISDEFRAGGYTWNLCIYPTGNKTRNGEDHISFLLGIGRNHFSLCWVGSPNWCENRYHSMNTGFGIAKFIDLSTFSNPVNGYLIDDTCVFGVEVFVVKNTLIERCLSMIDDPTTYFYTWKVANFSTLVGEKCVSEPFGHYKWNIVLYPNGNGEGKGNSISTYLQVSRSSIPLDTKVVVKFILRLIDQKNGKHIQFEENHMFASNNADMGCYRLISLAELNDRKRGYLVNDTLIIEAEVTLLGFAKLSSKKQIIY